MTKTRAVSRDLDIFEQNMRKLKIKDGIRERRTIGEIRHRIDDFCDVSGENVVLDEDISPTLPKQHPTLSLNKDKLTSSQKLFKWSVSIPLLNIFRERGLTWLAPSQVPSTMDEHAAGTSTRKPSDIATSGNPGQKPSSSFKKSVKLIISIESMAS